MAREDRALRALAASDPVPANGPALVSYMGGTTEATRVLSGLDRRPTPAERRADPAQEANYKRWRAASRQAQRWAKGEHGGTTDVGRHLDSKQRRRAQAINRERKRIGARAAGIRAQVTARIVIKSGAAGLRTDSRKRSILHDPSGSIGVLVNDPEIMDAILAGDTATAGELLHEAFLSAASMPEETSLEAPQWVLWVDGEDVPDDAEW